MSCATRRKIWEFLGLLIVRMSMVVILASMLLIVGFVIVRGIGVISWEFLTEHPQNSMTTGGIFPAIVGTVYLVLGAVIVAFPLGVSSAIYLTEYAGSGRLIRIIRFGINSLAGIPSVVFGLFGLAVFVVGFGFGSCVLSGGLTLGLLILPVIIGASEEALKAIPMAYREASLALGATRWQTIKNVVLPAALPGILTGSILGVGRAAGETAPIMFTAAAFYTKIIPKSVFNEVMALPYHIYVLATAGTHISKTRPIQYGTALVLISLVLGINAIAIFFRARIRRRHG